ncbi:MAG: hypothetical protein HY553_12745, partial [Elusimicrobia bacterium]|nr:hypothetical protein [Elusimicrobiota bacterium]
EDGERRRGPEHHAVDWKLKDTIVQAGRDKNLYNIIDSLFVTMPKSPRDYLIELCATRGVCDPVAACSTSDALYESCRAACAANPAKCRLAFPERPQEPDCRENPGDPRCASATETATGTNTGPGTSTASNNRTDTGGGEDDTVSNGVTHTDTYTSTEQMINDCKARNWSACARYCWSGGGYFSSECTPYKQWYDETYTCPRLPCNPGCPNANSRQCKCERNPCMNECSPKPSYCVGGTEEN